MPLILWLLTFVTAPSHAQEMATLPTRPGVTQSYFIAGLPQNPRAIALLFPGSGGLIRLREEKGQIRFGQNNFLVRTRGEFVKRGIIAAVEQIVNWMMKNPFVEKIE